jgi:hypothetical protein
MKEKTPEKSRQLAKADLNFISQKPLETIIQVLQSRQNVHITPEIYCTNSDTAVFRLTYNRDERTTAEVSGRLQRWAGDMTHIYCDGRIFRTKFSYIASFIRWIWLLIGIAPCVMWFLLMTRGAGSMPTFVYVFLISLLVGIITSVHILVSYLMRQQHHNPQKGLAKPEQKDRERLLHFLTEIVRDDDFQQVLTAQDSQPVEPLSDEEIAMIVEQAERMAKSGKF